MKFSTFVVLDSETSLSSIRESRNSYEYTDQGAIIYPLDTPLPIIRSGSGCIGIAVISRVNMTSSSTTISFSVTQIDQASAKAYYGLYKNTASMNQSSTDDVYSNSADVVIPGLIKPQSSKIKTPKRYNQRNDSLSRSSGISDYDDYDD
jgi:hypothetical protein